MLLPVHTIRAPRGNMNDQLPMLLPLHTNRAPRGNMNDQQPMLLPLHTNRAPPGNRPLVEVVALILFQRADVVLL